MNVMALANPLTGPVGNPGLPRNLAIAGLVVSRDRKHPLNHSWVIDSSRTPSLVWRDKIREIVADRLRVNAKRLRRGLQSAFLQFSRDRFPLKRTISTLAFYRAMQRHVLAPRQHLQIVETVIRLHLVAVMHMQVPGQKPALRALNDKPVLRDKAPAVRARVVWTKLMNVAFLVRYGMPTHIRARD